MFNIFKRKNKGNQETSQSSQVRIGFIQRRILAFKAYKAEISAKMAKQRDYFASEGEEYERLKKEREAEQEARNAQFKKELRSWAIGGAIFLGVYALMRLVLGLW